MKWYSALNYNYCYERFVAGRSKMTASLVAVQNLLRDWIVELTCRLRGHDMVSNFVDPENGYEELGCKRCGETFECYF